MSLLKQVGIIRKGSETRELFMVEGQLITFNTDNSSFDVIGQNIDSLAVSEMELENSVVHTLCTSLDNMNPSTQNVVMILKQSGLGLVEVYYGAEGFQSIIRPSAEGDFSSMLSSISREECAEVCRIVDVLRTGDCDSIESPALIKEYKETFLTV